jgi:dTDP-4-dehydrorhamnose 3,5-epimerase
VTLPRGVHVIELTTRGDPRGSFTETFRQEWLPAGVPGMVQTNLSISRTGVLRGMHVHQRQADYWCVIEGAAFVALHDLRADSPTHGTTWSETFDASKGLRGLYVPPGVAHGFCALTDLRMLYLVDSYFTGDDEFGFAWDDADAAIGWPISDPVVSERDAGAPALAEVLAGLPRSEG